MEAEDSGAPHPLMQWKLTDHGPLDEQVHIQVGTLERGYYVDHTGFGRRLFPDKRTAWEAIKDLMRRHRGTWRETPCDRAPFDELRPPDASRVLYDTGGNCLFGHWGEDKDERWDRYLDALADGRRFHETEAHALFGGAIEAVTFMDPDTGAERHAVTIAIDPGSDYRVVDYPDRDAAAAAYEREVHDHADEEFRYRWSDLPEVPVDPASSLPKGLKVLGDGTVMNEDDHEYLYGAPPSRMTWPRTPPSAAPRRVRGMTAAPRDWGPGEAHLEDVTPAEWQDENPELRANALVLLALADGRVLLASAHDGAARMWSARDGRQLRNVVGHSEWVLSVGLVALEDGQVVLATGGKDGLAREWTAQEGKPVREIEAHRSPVNAVAWVCPPDEIPWLVTGSDDATVRVWEPDTRGEIAVLEAGRPSVDIVWSVATAVLPDGHVCVVAGTDDSMTASVHVWDVTAGQRLHRFTIERDDADIRGPQVAVVTLADRSFRVAVAVGATVRVWDGLTGEPVRTFSLPDARESAVAMAVLPDLRVAVAATDGGRTVLWDAESGVELATATSGRPDFPHAVALAARPDGGLLLAVGRQDGAPARMFRLDL
ncbi:WD40 repeat domain-containing protein [Amycolatopsis plumensis]|uniref:WD40 repeat domain-containing protein n=1 Tax=Amycolatopsis plumensis TaxID=236508 RepID=A0ABV5U414_9PSEU